MNVALRGMPPLWVIHVVVSALLILVRNRVRKAAEIAPEASSAPWIVIDGRTGFERFLAHLWMYALFFGPAAAFGLVTTAQVADLTASGAEPSALSQW